MAGIPFEIFTKFAEFVLRFRIRLTIKLGPICSRGSGVMGVLSTDGLVSPKFSASPSGEIMRRTPKVLEVQKRSRGPLITVPCLVGLGLRPPPAQSKTLNFLFVCFFVRHVCERQNLCARFRHEGVGVQKRF